MKPWKLECKKEKCRATNICCVCGYCKPDHNTAHKFASYKKGYSGYP